MRPHSLRCTAFGPFAGTVEVDLDLLATSGLFLLHGETGAGKTTLLDAMGFALYGTVPGERGKAGRLRSDHAPAALRTEVQLEVTLAGRRVRVTRSPQQERRKQRGSGTTVEQARVLLEERVGGTWTTLSTRIAEAADEILDLVGMSAEQFFQVVLLPQGEFAQFLKARSEQRGQLLQRLFSTERFSAVEDWLARRRVATATEVAQARSRLALVAARVAQAAQAEEPEQLTAQWALELRDAAAAELQRTTADSARCAERQQAARIAAETTGRLAAAQRRRTELLAEAARLAAAAPALGRARAEVEAAARAVEVSGLLEQVARREAEVERATGDLAAARSDLLAVGLAPDESATGLRAAVTGGRTRAGRLEALRAVAESVERERRIGRAAEEAAVTAEAELQAVGMELSQVPATREARRAQVVDGRAAAARLPAAQAELTRLVGAAAAEAGLARLLADAASLREELLFARERAVSLRDKAADVREARLDDVRFELASMLVDGDPCAVCGSTTHPDPSEVRGERVTRDDEDAARREADDGQREVEQLGRRLSGLEGEIASVTAGLGSVTGEELRAALVRAEWEVAELAPVADALAGAEVAAGELDQLERALADRSAALSATARAERRRAEESASRAGTGQAQLTAALEGEPDLDTALASAAAVVVAAERVLEADQVLGRAQQERAEAGLLAEAAAVAAGFPDVVAARAAARPAAWRAEQERLLRADADARAANAAGLAAPDLQVALEPPADVAGAGEALTAADAELRAADALRTTAASRLRDLEELVPGLLESFDELDPLQERARVARELADLCGGAGSNQLRMTLSSFVLAARLEEVAAAASVRLLRMTQGRYTLVHTDGTARGGARSGLGLLARDSWTGQDRETSTLSGGETFLASLALALGLTDVVVAESGGARIEALFVDEGFGTLDEDTLDEVMDVLDGLREGGRVVGLVSHVAELRSRIPAQVHVRKTRSGSDVVLLGC
jgi:exonuclease SbcC